MKTSRPAASGWNLVELLLLQMLGKTSDKDGVDDYEQIFADLLTRALGTGDRAWLGLFGKLQTDQ